MIIPRRPPWYRDRGVPCDGPEDVWRMENVYTHFGEGCVDYQRELYQKWGLYREMVDSEHVRFTAEEAFAILDCLWIEIILLDERIALRSRVIDVMSHYTQSRRAGVDMLGVYMPLFCANHLRSLGDLHVGYPDRHTL